MIDWTTPHQSVFNTLPLPPRHVTVSQKLGGT